MGEWNGEQPRSRSRADASVGSCQGWTAVLRKLLEQEDDVDSSGSIKRELKAESEMRVGVRERLQMALQHCPMDLILFGFVFRT